MPPRPPGLAPPPRPGAGDVLRTLRVALTDLPALVWGLVTARESTNTPAGLARTAADFSRVLRHLAIGLEVLHAARVPAAGGLVFMWNQESHLDHLVLAAAIPRPFLSIYNNEVARLPLYGEHLRRHGHIHVDRTDKAKWRAALARAAAIVQAGTCIVVSPEGTRSWDGELLPMKPGAFILAATAGVPIVCVTVIGAHHRMPRGSPWVRRGPVRIVFSEPIAVAGAATDVLADTVAATFRDLKRVHRL